MTKAKDKPAVNEIEVLFPEERVGAFVLRPWSLEQLALLLPTLMQFLQSLQAKGLNEAQVQAVMEDGLQLLPDLAPFIPRILMVTLRLSPEEVAAIPSGTRIALALRILLHKQNQEEIKNFLAGLLGDQLQSRSPAIH